MTELHKMQGESTSSVAEEDGEQKYLRKTDANKVLVLKEGAPVMLIRNLSETLVNGLLGIVLQLEDDGRTVKFEDKIITLSKVTFSVYDIVLQLEDDGPTVKFEDKIKFKYLRQLCV